ncbi:high-affinity cell membrane calcium channel [Crucibulum laeve]|uniref:Calcium-channel protein CCH1 n=1 Tax=Crucibulum laeve TaxID=68775 RepID=A0A5C3M1B9_9AGAR|nr:high-affinity cell membrane calcium channel [Crucibulum laeve]
MDRQDIYLHHPSPSKSSTSTSISIASAPPSPSLEPSDSRSSFARRRTSWAARLIDPGQDPLRLDLSDDTITPVQSAPPRFGETGPVLPLGDDPFYSPTHERSSFAGTHPYTADDTRYGRQHSDRSTYTDRDPYSTSQAGPSTASLIAPSHEAEMEDGHREDDEAHLTGNMSRSGESEGGEMWASEDPEHDGGATPRSRRRTLRYSTSPSPLKKTGTAIKSVSKNLRRVSLRVVNLANSGLENQLRLADGEESVRDDEEPPNLSQALPIRGRTLGFLGSDSKLRLALFNFLVYPWTEPIILILIVLNAVILTIQAFPSLTLPTADGPALPPKVKGYFHTWEDYALFALFVVFTLEAFARICVTGFLFDPEVYISSLFSNPLSSQSDTNLGSSGSNVTRQSSLSRTRSITQKIGRLHHTLTRPFALSDKRPSDPPPTAVPGPMTAKALATARDMHTGFRDPSKGTFFSRALRSDNANGDIALPFRLSIGHLHNKTQRNVPYLRQSWSRIDFVAIVSFWVSFILATTGIERGEKHIGVFRAMSVIRTARLLTITSGTTTIMHSLKTARPLLTSVAYFVLFAIVLFSIIGIQSFKGSLRRTCVLQPTLGESEVLIDGQFCGGYIDPVSARETGYITMNNQTSTDIKGYICPIGQVCKELTNPNNNIESFDAIHYAALQVIIVATANGWAPLMYSMIDSEFFISCFFFIICLIVLNFWLINLFVAVITNTFSAIRSETKKSAFGAAPLIPMDENEEDGWAIVDGRLASSRNNLAKVIYDHTRWCWVILALASLSLQATRTVDISETHELLLYYGELGITVAFDFEIGLRVLATLPKWRSFFQHGNNWLDTILAIGSTIIQVPVIRKSSMYPWFTIFQLARFYRVILEVPRMKPLLLAVFGNMYGLANMSLFLVLINYIAALVAVQLFRGDFGDTTTINFGELFNAFLAMYQVFSSENWVDILYGASGAEIQLGQTVLALIFIASWMLFANFIILQMFIAVINENFEVAEEAKKGKQASKYLAAQKDGEGSAAWLRRFNPYRWVKANPVTVKVENLPQNLVLPMQKTLVQDYGVRPSDSRATPKTSGSSRFKPRHYPSKSLTALQRLFAGETRTNDIPLASLRHARQDTLGHGDHYNEEMEKHLELLASVNPEDTTAEDADDVFHERRAQKADFIRDHPTYDKTFWFISQKNIIRKMCQKLTQPARGERIFGTLTSPIAHPIFQLILLLTVIGGIVVESIATPIYRRNYYATHGLIRGSWFDIAEATFGFTLFVEFLIKIIADGFVFTPNAYVRSIWNILDFLIMVGIIVNVSTGLIFIGGLSRFTRSLKALRALRLITLIDRMRFTFQSLILSGALRIMDAAVLAILYMIPYAVWGLNIFAGKMNMCNDDEVPGMAECVGEYTNSVYDEAFAFPIPRAWDNPSPSTQFSFDSFRASLLILFEIVSLEGWIDVMGVAMSITGEGQQPHTNASQGNAIFFLIYNLMGGVVILTLFISIIIGNFSSKTGSAFLTQPQREWIDLQKLFKRQRPSKRPKLRPANKLRAWCFDRAVHKHGWWSRAMTLLFILHITALMTQSFSTNNLAETFRNDFFLVLMFIYLIDVSVRWYGLGWRSFRANGWNLFDIVVAGGSFITTLVVRFGSSGFITQQLQKLFLVSIAFKLIQRTNSLNMLFKTAVASLPVILSLLGLWLILFIFFAILNVEVFGLTKWGGAENRNQNYFSLGSAMVMLAFQSTGEGWNQYMHDFDLTYPRCTNSGVDESESDCGSTEWAFTLFIAWNLLSMYIFVNMFTGVVVENFSYVFQASGSGAKSISREQMRSFKKIWAEFANQRTGYLERQRFAAFFGRLNGVFEVRIYPTEYSIPNVMAACVPDPEGDQPSSPRRVRFGIDLDKLNRVLSTIDYSSIRKRKAVYSRLYHEAIITHQQGLGMSFTDMLMLLAHHKLIVDAEALVLKDLVVRTETNKLVTDLVNLDRVRSLLKTISRRRRFLAYLEQKRTAEQEIPSIVVEVPPETPVIGSRDITNSMYDTTSAPNSPEMRQRFSTADVSLSYALDTSMGPGGSRLQRSSRRNSEFSMFSADASYRSQRSSLIEEDPQDVVSAMQNSLWGDLMMEAAEEEKGGRF